MRHNIARALRKLANRVDPPRGLTINIDSRNRGLGPTPSWHAKIAKGLLTPAQIDDVAKRAANYHPGQLAGIGVAGLMETLDERPDRRRDIEFVLVDLDLAYQAGVIAFIGAGFATACQLWWLAVPLLVIGFALCSWFG